jgi:DNA modification methylase
MHPTVKPVAMLADAILDASNPSDIVLDCFVGSGSTLVAAAKTRRVGYGIELDPIFCDVTLARLSKILKLDPIHVASARTFDEISTERRDAEREEDES